MAINNREDANRYYQVINGLVDDYLDRWKIRPSSLKRYLQPGSERFNKFLERNKLKDVKGAEVILKDVIEDRYHMEKDGVITFESFKMFESEEFKIHSLKQCLYKGIEKSSISHEKIIADHFDTNLGDIDILDSDKHLFKINDWNGEDTKVVIYTKEEIEIIEKNMVDFLYDELSKKSIEIVNGIKVNLSDMIKSNVFEEQMSEMFGKDNLLLETISKCLGDDVKFKDEFNGHFIWIF